MVKIAVSRMFACAVALCSLGCFALPIAQAEEADAAANSATTDNFLTTGKWAAGGVLGNPTASPAKRRATVGPTLALAGEFLAVKT